MQKSRNTYVFLSYSHSDMGFVKKFEAELRKRNIPCFRDESRIEWGADIPKSIHDALRRATHIIVFISPGSEKSAWVSYEVGFARGNEAEVIPYLLHPKMNLPGFLATSRAIKSKDEAEKFLSRLARTRREASSKSEVARARKEAVSDNQAIRDSAFSILIQHNDREQITKFLNHRKPKVRTSAAKAALKLRMDDCLPILVAGLAHTGPRSHRQIIPCVDRVILGFGKAGVDELFRQSEEIELYHWLEALRGDLISTKTLWKMIYGRAKTEKKFKEEVFEKLSEASIFLRMNDDEKRRFFISWFQCAQSRSRFWRLSWALIKHKFRCDRIIQEFKKIIEDKERWKAMVWDAYPRDECRYLLWSGAVSVEELQAKASHFPGDIRRVVQREIRDMKKE